MNDVKWDLVKNCEVFGVYQKLPSLWNEYTIELIERKKDSVFPEYHTIKIQSSKLYDELVELKEDKRDKCILAYGMADIDVYKRNKVYVIMNSPTEGYYCEYELSTKEFEGIISALKPVKI
jgi:PhoPQ-activated pathogenicity-related protein